MGDFLPTTSPLLGDLRFDNVLLYYDAPVLFLARNQLGHRFLAYAVADDGEITTYLYVPVSEDRATAITVGGLPVRAAVLDAESETQFTVEIGPASRETIVRELKRSEIPTAWLPDESLEFSERVETARPFSVEDLAQSAYQQNRQLVALEVDTPERVRRTELPLRVIGPLATEFQKLVDVFPGNVEFAFSDRAAASFVLVLSPIAAQDQLFAEASTAIGQIASLFESTSNVAVFEANLPDLTRRQQIHVRDFFDVLDENSTGATLFTASPSGVSSQVSVSLDGVRAGLQAIRSIREISQETLEIVGYIYAINHPNRRFGFEESTPTGRRRKPRQWTGKFDPAIDINGLASGRSVLYRVTITRESVAPAYDEEQLKFTNRITSLERASSGGATASPIRESEGQPRGIAASGGGRRRRTPI